jgi:hypothetical protein
MEETDDGAVKYNDLLYKYYNKTEDQLYNVSSPSEISLHSFLTKCTFAK